MNISGVVLALGSEQSGSELRAAVGAAALLRVANRPLAHHAVDLLLEAGVSGRIVVAASAGTRPELRRGLDEFAGSAATVSYIEVPRKSGPVDALLAALSRIGPGPVVVVTGDGLVVDGLRRAIERFLADEIDVAVLSVIDHADVVVAAGVGRHPTLARSAPVGVQIFSPFALEVASRHEMCAGSAADLDDLAGAVREAGGLTDVEIVPRGWCHTGGDSSVLVANAMMLDWLVARARGREELNPDVPGHAFVHPTATVERSTLRGPVTIGPGARVIDAYVGPYTAVGAEAVIEGSEIEYSIVLDRAKISFVSSRIEGSLIGSSARVSQTFTRPSGLRVHLGSDHSLSLG